MLHPKNNQTDHHISEEALTQAQKHSDISIKHGKKAEQLGKKLQKEGNEQGKKIEEHGKKIQEYAKASQQNAEAAQRQEELGEGATGIFTTVVEKHVKQTQEQVQAVREYGKILKKQIQESNAILDNINEK